MPSRMFATARRAALSAPRRAGAETGAKRFSSTKPPPSLPRKILSSTLLLASGAVLATYYYDSKSLLHEHVLMPVVRYVADPEEGHRAAVKLLAMGAWARPKDKSEDVPELEAQIWDMKLKNPVGMAAGFDKDAEAIDGLFDLGFGYVEIGSVTPEPQPGNPKPRFFRLEEDQACINRYGFNSLGHRQALHRLQQRIRDYAFSHPSEFPNPLPLIPLPPPGVPRSLRHGQLLGVNLGKNKTSAADSNEDYIRGVRLLGPYADVLVVNVSSPNTPGLRGLQGKDFLGRLLREVVEERDALKVDASMRPKVVVKVAPDLDQDELADVAQAVRASGVEGIIISNTTIKRDELDLQSANASETGGLSGAPLFPHSLKALKVLRHNLPPSIPVIGCGGITTGADALEMARAGASFVQLYTAFGYRGVGCARNIKDEITTGLDGKTWKSQVGSEAGEWEDQFGKIGEEVKREAASLADVLKQLRDVAKDKVESGSDQMRLEGSKLVRAVEQALGLPESEWSAERTSPTAIQDPASSTARITLPKNDASTAASAIQAASTSAPTAAADVQSQPVTQHDPLVAPGPNATVADAMKPIVVPVSDPTPRIERPSSSSWTSEVREGNRRFV